MKLIDLLRKDKFQQSWFKSASNFQNCFTNKKLKRQKLDLNNHKEIIIN